MGLKYSRLATWLIVYEVVYIVVSTVTGLLFLYSSKASPIESIGFIKNRGVLDAVLHIWLNNTISFLIAATLIVLHPSLGVLAVSFSSISSGELFASWLAHYCSTPHFIYGVAETQAYIVLWLLVARTYYAQRECSSLTCRWRTTSRQTGRILFYAFTVFLILAMVEVAEVRLLG